jgi:hypothetical protein
LELKISAFAVAKMIILWKNATKDLNSLKYNACKRSGHVKKVYIRSLLDVKTTKPEFTYYDW